MSYLEIAVLLVGVWLILIAATTVSSTLTLIFGIAVVVLTLLPMVQARSRSGP